MLVTTSKSVTLGNRMAVKGTEGEGIKELLCEGGAPFDLTWRKSTICVTRMS